MFGNLNRFFQGQPKQEVLSDARKAEIIFECDQNFHSLKEAIGKIGEIKNVAGKIYSAQELKRKIDELERIARLNPPSRTGVELCLQAITRACGIKDKAREIALNTSMFPPEK